MGMAGIARIGREARLWAWMLAAGSALVPPAVAASVLAPSAVAAQPVFDEIYTYGDGRLAHATLPNGPASPATPAAFGIYDILLLPSGRMLATTLSTANPRSHTVLNELMPDGSLRQIGEVPPPYGYPAFEIDEPVDLALDSGGRLYLLTFAHRPDIFSSNIHRLVELDPETAEVRGWIVLPDVASVATAPDGLWAVTGEGIVRLDPESGDLGKPVVDLDLFGMVSEMEADSGGRLWFVYEHACSPPCIRLGTADPATGVAEQAPALLHAQTPLMHTLTIRRRCVESATVRCLQGGRFRAEASFADFAGVEGIAKVAPARSGDSGLFHFFDPANWELMVKVLDGCAQNGNFWVFSSGSTDVAYELKITDTQTGAAKTYRNPLGQAAPAAGDIAAFPCTAGAPRSTP
jgi:hypothetical protein